MNTPVALFVFRRPDLAAQVFREIAKAKPPVLLLVSDWPRDSLDQRKCLECRALAAKVDWDCQVLTCFAEQQMGCKRRVSTGLDWVFSQVEEAVILEDDCLPHPSFFRFCDELLERYRHDERIGHVSGSNLHGSRARGNYSYFFSRHLPIWGWATWRRAWRDYDVNMEHWPLIRDGGWDVDMWTDRAEAARLGRRWDPVHAGKVDTWDAQWHFSQLRNGRLAVVPEVNLITNIGFREDATHTRCRWDPFAGCPSRELAFPLRHPPFVIADRAADIAYSRVAFPARRFHWRRMLMILWRSRSSVIRPGSG